MLTYMSAFSQNMVCVVHGCMEGVWDGSYMMRLSPLVPTSMQLVSKRSMFHVSDVLFKFNYLLFGYYDPVNIFFNNINKQFWGDLCDFSSIMATMCAAACTTSGV